MVDIDSDSITNAMESNDDNEEDQQVQPQTPPSTIAGELMNGEEACENKGLTRSVCLGVGNGSCCWDGDDGKCMSAIGQNNCPGSSAQKLNITMENGSCEKAVSLELPVEFGTDIVVEGIIGTIPDTTYEDTDAKNCLSGLETVGGWYDIVGDGNIYTLTACWIDPSKSVGIHVFTGDACSDLVCIENQSRQNAKCGKNNNNGYAISWVSEGGKTYHVLVSGLPIGVDSSSSRRRLVDSTQIYELKFREEEVPVNTECQRSVSVESQTPIKGMIVADDAVATVSTTCTGSATTGVWFTISDGTPTQKDGSGILVYEANTCNTQTNFNNEISVFRGSDCDSLTCVDVDVLPCQNGAYGQAVYWTTSIEETFHLFVHAGENENENDNDGVTLSTYDAGQFMMGIYYADRRVGNDQCGAALLIRADEEEEIGSTDGTKPDMNAISSSSCETGGAGAWFRITGDASTFQVTTCSNTTDHKTSIHVYSGVCERLNCIDFEGGNVNQGVCSSNTMSATVNFKTQDGLDYYILVTGRRGQIGNFGLQVTTLETAPNNECDKGELLTLDNSAVEGSTLNATVDFPPNEICGVALDTPGVWYTVEGTGKGVELSTCQNNTFDTAISVFKGSSCRNLECITGTAAKDPLCDNGGVTAAWLTEENTQYYVYVHGTPSPNNMGSFTLTSTEFDVLEENEFCAQASVIPTDGSRIQGSTEDATHAAIYSSSCGVDVVNPGLWYAFKGTGQPFSISACAEDEDEFDVSVSIFTGTCDDLTCVTGSTFVNNYCLTDTARTVRQRRRYLQQFSSNDFRFLTKNLQDYYVYVHGQNGVGVGVGVGDFDLYINEDVNSGFGTIAPTTTPGKFGKDLFRWIPINNNITIVTDYPALTIVVPPKAGGTATVKKSAIEYSPPLDYVGADVIAVEGCIQSDCYRFDITVEVMGKEEDVGVGGKYYGGDDDDGGEEDGWNKLWLLVLLLLLIPCVCVPLLYFLYQKKKTEEENEYESADDGEDGDFRDVFEDDIEDGRLLPRSGNDDSSDDDDEDWESRSDDDDDEDESEEDSDDESDISIEDSSEDEDQWSSEEDEDSDEYDDDTGFDDESLNSR